jgi:hypothetical protein
MIWPGWHLEKIDRGHDLAGLAIAALRDIELDPGFLHGVQAVVAGREALDRRYRTALERGHRYPAGHRGVAIKMHGTGPAKAHAAAEFRAGESEVVAQHPEQGGVFIAVECHGLVVDHKRDHLSTSRLR